MNESEKQLKNEKSELQEKYSKDLYQTDLSMKENEQLRQAKKDWEKERDDLMGTVEGLEDENERVYC